MSSSGTAVCAAYALTFAAILTLAISGTALAAGPPNPSESRLIAGGGRIWEGSGPAGATADIVFSGFTSKVGPGTTPDDYRCEWQVHFVDVSVDWLDRKTARMTKCQHVYGNTTAGHTGTLAEAVVDGVPGYWLTIIFAWHEGRIDQVRILLREANTEPEDAVYDTRWDFTLVEAYRTALDVGMIHAWIED